MKIKDFIGICNDSVVVSIRIKNEKMLIVENSEYYGVVTRIPDTLLEYDILSIDDAIDIATNTAVLIIDVKAKQYNMKPLTLKAFIKQGCTRTRVLRVKTENEEVLYDGTAGDIPEELLEANWLVKMTELNGEKRPALVLILTVIKREL